MSINNHTNSHRRVAGSRVSHTRTYIRSHTYVRSHTRTYAHTHFRIMIITMLFITFYIAETPGHTQPLLGTEGTADRTGTSWPTTRHKQQIGTIKLLLERDHHYTIETHLLASCVSCVWWVWPYYMSVRRACVLPECRILPFSFPIRPISQTVDTEEAHFVKRCKQINKQTTNHLCSKRNLFRAGDCEGLLQRGLVWIPSRTPGS